jgi:multicomponent Na+:H+ antiporter subunit E
MSIRVRFAVQALVLLAFWLALSDQYSPLFLGMGIASALVLTALTGPLVSACFERRPTPLRPLHRLWHTVFYFGWLIGRMVVAGAQIAYFVLHPRMPLRPGVLRFRTTLRSPLARVVLANSITLVPGTLTVRLTGDEFVVHALVPASADDLLDGRMQQVVGRMFLEEPDDPLTASWDDPLADPLTETAP